MVDTSFISRNANIESPAPSECLVNHHYPLHFPSKTRSIPCRRAKQRTPPLLFREAKACKGKLEHQKRTNICVLLCLHGEEFISLQLLQLKILNPCCIVMCKPLAQLDGTLFALHLLDGIRVRTFLVFKVQLMTPRVARISQLPAFGVVFGLRWLSQDLGMRER